MKKIIFIGACLLMMGILAAFLFYHLLSVPPHVRQGDGEAASDSLTPSGTLFLDDRVRAAITEGRNAILEDKGLDIPYSADLLRTIERHFDVDMEYQGAGLYQGKPSENIAVELLLNSSGNVGRVQLSITELAEEPEIRNQLKDFVVFLNTNLEEDTTEQVLEEALPRLQDLKSGEEYLYFDHGVGFAGTVTQNHLIIYIP